MTSTRARGNELERKAQAQLEAEGYLVERARPQIVWLGPGRAINKRVDLFGCFDLLAIMPAGIRLIQVCADVGGHAAERRTKIEAFAAEFDGLNARVFYSLELWRHRGGRAKKGDRLPRGFLREKYYGDWWTLHPLEHASRNP